MKDNLEVLFAVVVLVIILCGGAAFASASCSAKWGLSGLNSEWGLLKGCMVQRKDGTWVPDKTIRELSP